MIKLFIKELHPLSTPLQIKHFYFEEPLQNWSYLIWQGSTGYVIDPFDSKEILAFTKKNKIHILGVLNTHDHFDHIRGNQAIVDDYKCSAQMGNFQNLWENHITIKSHFTPGHCSEHYVYSFGEQYYFMGDLLFQGGVGRCLSGGDPYTLAKSLLHITSTISENASWYPGHDYWDGNFAFASQFDYFKDNLLALPHHQQGVLQNNTFGFELKHNIFLWSLIDENWQKIQDPIKGKNPIECFVHLRAEKDQFKR